MHSSLTLARAASRTPLALLVAFGSPNRARHDAMGTVAVALVGCVLLVAVMLAHPLVGDAPQRSARALLDLIKVQ